MAPNQSIQKLTPDQLEAQITAIDTAVKDFGLSGTFTQVGSLSTTLRLARGMQQLRTLLTDDLVREVLLPLRGSKLGFLTDRDSGQNGPLYDIEVIRDVSIEALLRGFQPVGNEFNVIAGGFYAAKNGIARKLREYPGLTNLEPRPGRVVISQDGESALVSFRINYLLDGTARSLVRDVADIKDISTDQRVQVRVNKRMGYDGIIGKAHRKAMALLLDHLTGSTLSLPTAELDDNEPINTTAEASPSPAADAAEKPTNAQAQQYQDVLKKHAPANGAAPTPDEAAADERANSGK